MCVAELGEVEICGSWKGGSGVDKDSGCNVAKVGCGELAMEWEHVDVCGGCSV